MAPKDLFQIFILYNPEMSNKVSNFKEIQGKPNTIKLIFRDGRTGTFEVKRGKFKLVLEDDLYSIKEHTAATKEESCPYAAKPMHDEACVPFETCEECKKYREAQNKT